MPDFGRNPDLDAVARADRLLDALAAAESPVCSDPAEQELAGLLGAWRDELRRPPPTGQVSEASLDASVALEGRVVTALHDKMAPRRRTHRVLTVASAAAAALLALGGVGAVVGTAHPGSPLYGLRTMVLGEPASLQDERIVLTAKTELEKVQRMIADGQWDQAQERLTTLGDTVQTVNDAGRKQDLVDQWNRLNVQVLKRDPNAVAPVDEPPSPRPSPPVEVLVPNTHPWETAPSPGSQTPPP